MPSLDAKKLHPSRLYTVPCRPMPSQANNPHPRNSRLGWSSLVWSDLVWSGLVWVGFGLAMHPAVSSLESLPLHNCMRACSSSFFPLVLCSSIKVLHSLYPPCHLSFESPPTLKQFLQRRGSRGACPGRSSGSPRALCRGGTGARCRGRKCPRTGS